MSEMTSEREAFEMWVQGISGWKACKQRGKPMHLRKNQDGSYNDFRVNDRWFAWQARARTAQPAQAVDVGAEDRFEQYVKTLIDKAPDVQKLGERLAHLLDEDQFNNIEPTLLGIARALGNAPENTPDAAR